jgi:hypothetical protein
MDNHARAFLPVMKKASLDFLATIRPTLTPLYTGHVPLDADVTPMDNSGSCKEGVSGACRRRIKTVMQELMYVAARVVKTSRSIKLTFGTGCRALLAYTSAYEKLAYG